nr:unnamed protein product [Callosobruchus chinensis]
MIRDKGKRKKLYFPTAHNKVGRTEIGYCTLKKMDFVMVACASIQMGI